MIKINRSKNINSIFKCDCGVIHLPEKDQYSYVILKELLIFDSCTLKEIYEEALTFIHLTIKKNTQPATIKRQLQRTLQMLKTKRIIIHTPRQGYRINDPTQKKGD